MVTHRQKGPRPIASRGLPPLEYAAQRRFVDVCLHLRQEVGAAVGDSLDGIDARAEAVRGFFVEVLCMVFDGKLPASKRELSSRIKQSKDYLARQLDDYPTMQVEVKTHIKSVFTNVCKTLENTVVGRGNRQMS